MGIFTSPRRTIIGAAALFALMAGSLLTGSGPSDAIAEQSEGCPAVNDMLIDVHIASTILVPGVTAERALQVELMFACPQEGVHIERGHGTVVIDVPRAGSVKMPVEIGQVPPGTTWTTIVEFDWNEQDITHRRLREAWADSSTTFVADALRTVVLSATPSVVEASHRAQGASPVRASIN
ncbi:MAG: hypothetical protein MK101_08040 [Phycisphaerales bacterium]|nr:hypothetical protein [Phycisphaerales bacterium]